MRVLVIDNDAAEAEAVAFALACSGHEVLRAASAAQGLATASGADVALVAQGLPDAAGFELVRALVEGPGLPTVALGDGQAEEPMIRAFAAGAEDYVGRPVRLAELLARVQAVARRRGVTATRPGGGPVLQKGPLRLDQHRLEVHVRRPAGSSRPSGAVKLTPMEAKLLYVLMVNADQVMTKARLQELIWGYQGDSSGDLLKTHVRHLRVKVEERPGAPALIQTINGVGYTFVPDGEPEVEFLDGGPLGDGPRDARLDPARAHAI